MNNDHRETEFHDHAASQAVERLISQWDPQQVAEGEVIDPVMLQNMAALASLAYDLDPATPAASTKDNLMAIVATMAPPVVSPAPVAVSSPLTQNLVDRTLQHKTGQARDPRDQTFVGAVSDLEPPLIGSGANNVVPLRRAPRTTSWAPLALAAALAMCLIGLGYLYGQVTTQQGIIANQDQRLAKLSGVVEDLDEARGEVSTLHERLAMVNTVAREAYPLHSVSNRSLGVSATPDPSSPYGRVYVCGQHQQWYLTVNGLEPAPEQQEYHLWFMTKNGPVDAGVVEVKGGVAGLRDLSMPDETSGFSLTLEDAGAGDAPRGKTVLIGDTPVKL